MRGVVRRRASRGRVVVVGWDSWRCVSWRGFELDVVKVTQYLHVCVYKLRCAQILRMSPGTSERPIEDQKVEYDACAVS